MDWLINDEKFLNPNTGLGKKRRRGPPKKSRFLGAS